MSSDDHKILMVIAPQNFRDEELLEPKEIFEEAGYEVVIASTVRGKAQGMLEAEIEVDVEYNKVDSNEYKAVVFVGGTGSSVYFDDKQAWQLVRETLEGGKVLAAICIAPSILANAGVLEGKKATSYPSERQNLVENGVEYTAEDVTIDGKIVTGSGPDAATEFGKKILSLL